jgi:hypothetical protein
MVVAAVLATTTTASAAPEIYPLSKVRRGQTGYGFTTPKAGPPERFTFEVLSVMKNFLPKVDIVLIKSDDPMLATTGIWAGMSGSPLYIEDKLACAVSYGWSFNKITMGGCTPIELMKDEGLDVPRRGAPSSTATKGKDGKPGKAAPAAKQSKSGKTKTTSQTETQAIAPGSIGTMAEWRKLAPDDDVGAALGGRTAWALQPPLPPVARSDQKVDDQLLTASVPLGITGFSAPAFAELETMFAGYNVTPERTGGATTSDDPEAPAKLAMGGSISIILVRGDMSIAATGTVSYIDGNKVLAFGHPMFSSGEMYMPVATAKVHGVVASAQRPFVLAASGNEVGSMVQDRTTMIAADLGLRDPMIPVDIFVTAKSDKSTDKGEFHVDVLQDRFFTSGLAGAATANAINYYLPDRERVTAKITSKIAIKGHGELAFTDYLYAEDGASSIIGGARALRAANAILLNPYEEVELERVSVDVDLRFSADYGDIKEIQLPSQMLTPGKRAMVKVVMDTFENGEIVEEVPVDVPASLAGAIVQLDITAGDSARLDAAPAVDFDSLMAAIKKMLPGNVWAATLSVADEGVAIDGIVVRDLPPSAADKLRPASRTQRAATYKPIARTVSPAKRVLNGGASMMVRIADK